MGEVLDFPAEAPDRKVLHIDFNAFLSAANAVVDIAETGADMADRLTAFLRLAAKGIESVGHFRVEEVAGGFRLTAHASDSLCGIFETPKGAA